VGLTPPPPHIVPKVLEKRRAMPLLTRRACVAYKKGEILLLTSSRQSVLPSARNNSALAGQIFMIFNIGVFFENLS